ncbi:hypothetical protein AMJ85_06395 [candidate division BRC1 bacterium SM23_51]|nr:MAG: hypothetical protein AMJ85_06395 [candidate division BRC1 bacterium SM23_51]
MSRQYEKTAALTFFACLVIYTLACVMSPVSWSPDGRWIALTRLVGEEKEEGSKEEMTGSELWIVSPSPIERHRLMVTSGTMLSGPAWSNDSKGLYVVELPGEDTSKTVSLWRVDLNAKRRNVLRLEPTEDTGSAMIAAPALSPDGRRIAFVRDESAVVIARSSGRLEHVIEADNANNLFWSPDGRWLGILDEGGDDKPSVRFFDPRSSESIPLDGEFRAIAWLPDGKRFVALKRQKEGTTETFSISVLEGMRSAREVRSFPLDFETGHPLVPSRKGDSVFFARGEDGEEHLPAIHRLDLRTGKVTILYESLAPVLPWSISPDGKRLAFREGAPTEDDDPEAGMESLVGVLDLEATAQPLYLAVDDKELAAMVLAYADALKGISSDAELSPRQKQLASLFYGRLEQFLAAFRRDFPQSPLLAKCEAEAKEVQAAFEKAGLRVNPSEATPNR